MIKFSKEKILLLHQVMAEATGGDVGVRDETLLESAIENIFATFDGVEYSDTKIVADIDIIPGVAINETNFPDENFRSYVKKYIDLDGNGKLDETERNIDELNVGSN